MKKARIRFTCVCCGRRRGGRCLGGFQGKFRPLCADCLERLQRERTNMNQEDLRHE